MRRQRPDGLFRLVCAAPVPLPGLPDWGHVTGWLPDGWHDDAAPVLWLLGGSLSTCRSILGVAGAETLATQTIRGLVDEGTLPRGTCVLALGARDGYSTTAVTTAELALEDPDRASAAARDLMLRAERVALGRAGADARRRIVCGASYGGTVTARLMEDEPGIAGGWVLVSGLPWNRAYMARDAASEADALAASLARNGAARLVLATGDQDPTREGMAAIHSQLVAAHPEVAGRTRLVIRLGRHERLAFCDQARESLRTLADMPGEGGPARAATAGPPEPAHPKPFMTTTQRPNEE